MRGPACRGRCVPPESRLVPAVAADAPSRSLPPFALQLHVKGAQRPHLVHAREARAPQQQVGHQHTKAAAPEVQGQRRQGEPLLPAWLRGSLLLCTVLASTYVTLLRGSCAHHHQVLVVIRRTNWLARTVSSAELYFRHDKVKSVPGSKARNKAMYEYFRRYSKDEVSPDWTNKLATRSGEKVDEGTDYRQGGGGLPWRAAFVPAVDPCDQQSLSSGPSCPPH